MRSRHCRSSFRCARRSAPRSPPRGWSGRSRPSGDRSRRRRAPISTLPREPSRRPRRNSSPSAAFPAPANRSSRAMLAPEVNPMPGAVIVRSDVERKALFGVGETEKLPRRRLHRGRHGPRLCDARRQSAADRRRRPFGDRRCRVRAAAGASRHRRRRQRPRNSPLRGLFLTADVETRLGRVGARAARCLRCRCGRWRRPRSSYDLGPLDWTPVDASGTPEATLARAKAALASHLID